MNQLADVLQLVLSSEKEFVGIQAQRAEYLRQAEEANGQRDAATKEAETAEQGKKARLEAIDAACAKYRGEAEAAIKPSQDALTSLQGKVLTAKKDLEAIETKKADRLAALDGEIKDKEKRNADLESEFNALRRRFG